MRCRRFRGDRVSTTRVEPEETLDEPTFTSRQPLDYVPGILLLIGVGLLGKYAQIWWNTLAKHEHWRVPDIEYVLWAIVIGLLITNTLGLHRIFRPGVQTYEFWLKVGIVVLGARFVLGDIAKLGAISLVQILVDMTIAGTVIIVAARAFGLSGKLGSLLAIGTSICGVSAIIAAKGAIRARNSDVSYAIAAILALGAVSLFVLPPLGHAMGLTDHEFGLWAGLSVDNTAETTATGYLFSDHAGKIAVLVKSTRNALIGFVVLGFALYWSARGQADEIAPGATAKAAFIWQKFPKFVLGFLVVSAIATAGWLSKGQTTNLANVSKWAFLLTFAGVGLNTDFRQIARTGWRPLLVAVMGLTVVATVSLGIVLLTSRVLHWGVST
ncbi:MAG: YeiH family protein [Actinomycetota bacterium]|uniref:YeiH family protein n=1 Tax=Mycobacterium lentiflavum TaxID=141349 RepID=A0ABY3UW22_MYCLN|nr:YeiH family protein [Mycobacterium lentiflavum]MEE3067566.1 YeiH family protein [Actinomycetota bacterium]ULP41322.1 YeiH family protein [Mycobacterium lentiflavum]